MTPLFSYFTQGSIVTAILLLCYKLLLRRDTFFKWSRWYFISAVLASFLLPIVDFSVLFTSTAASPAVIQYLPDLSFTAYKQSNNPEQTLISSLFYAGMLVMSVRLLMQMIALLKLRRNKTIKTNHSLRIVELNERINPFSFFNEIYVNPQLHSEAELAEIIQHEQFHIEQNHTLDILLGEILTIVFWFNPFAWLLKNEMKQNLEFLTDKLVLQSGINAKHYQYNLLKVSRLQNNIAAANHFHFLKLKNRIMMMNKKQTNPFHAIKFLLLVPVVALLVMAFSERKQIIQTFNQTVLHDTVPPTPPPPTENKVTVTPTTSNVDKVTITNSISPTGEKQLPKNVKQVEVVRKDGKRQVTVTLRNGTKEVYDLNKEADQLKFEKKYGKIADIFPPPPPPTDAPSTISPPSSPSAPSPAIASVTKQEPILNSKGYYLSIADDDGECVVIVKDKSKNIVEAVILTDWDAAKAVYEKKYGQISSEEKPPKVSEVAPNTDASKNGPSNPYGAISGKFTFTNGVAPLIILNDTEMPHGYNINSIEVTDIESISVLKDQSAIAVYGDKGKNGVLIIKTKKKALNGIITKSTISEKITVAQSSEPTYVLNEKIISKEEMNKINPNQIESVNVLKGEEAIKLFGELGKNGVVKITLKK